MPCNMKNYKSIKYNKLLFVSLHIKHREKDKTSETHFAPTSDSVQPGCEKDIAKLSKLR